MTDPNTGAPQAGGIPARTGMAALSAAASPYGKFIGAGVGNMVALAVIETVNQNLSQPLGPLTEAVIMMAGNMIAVYLAKHGWIQAQPAPDAQP